MSNSVVVEEIGRAVIIRFNRPEIRSPLSIDVLEELSTILDRIEEPDDVDTVIFTGVGNVFASGADLREISKVNADGAREFAVRGQKLMQQIYELPINTIAAVNGICFGGALDLALACKHRIASPDAVFSHPGTNLGIITGWGGTQRLPRYIGEARALEMFFTARRVTADEARAFGLVDRVVADTLESALNFAEV